jgi:hypothetical protein
MKATAPKTSSSAVETSAAATAVTATLGKRGRTCAKNDERSESRKKSFEQGGILHVSYLHLRAAAQAGKPSLVILLRLDLHCFFCHTERRFWPRRTYATCQRVRGSFASLKMTVY